MKTLKKYIKLLTITPILVILTYNANAQTNTKTPDPQFLNHIYYFKADSLISLEQAEARLKSKTKAFGYGGSESAFIMDGEKSSLRIKSGDQIQFAVKVGISMEDPSMMIHLYKFEPRKGNREAILSSDPGVYGKKKNDDKNQVNFNVQKSGNDVYLIIPASSLSPGEYGFLNTMLFTRSGMKMDYTVFAFGID